MTLKHCDGGRHPDGVEICVDDEDGFSAHRLAVQYPAEPVTRIEAECNRIYTAVKARQAPFDGTDAAWCENGRS